MPLNMNNDSSQIKSPHLEIPMQNKDNTYNSSKKNWKQKETDNQGS